VHEFRHLARWARATNSWKRLNARLLLRSEKISSKSSEDLLEISARARGDVFRRETLRAATAAGAQVLEY
jgi:hypothetical protein